MRHNPVLSRQEQPHGSRQTGGPVNQIHTCVMHEFTVVGADVLSQTIPGTANIIEVSLLLWQKRVHVDKRIRGGKYKHGVK